MVETTVKHQSQSEMTQSEAETEPRSQFFAAQFAIAELTGPHNCILIWSFVLYLRAVSLTPIYIAGIEHGSRVYHPGMGTT